MYMYIYVMRNKKTKELSIMAMTLILDSKLLLMGQGSFKKIKILPTVFNTTFSL